MLTLVQMPAVVYLIDVNISNRTTRIEHEADDSQVYLFDANSALAANALIRSIVAAAFPLFAQGISDLHNLPALY